MDQFSDFNTFISSFQRDINKVRTTNSDGTPKDDGTQGSKELYKLILLSGIKDKSLYDWLSKLEIVRGPTGRVFLRGQLTTQPNVYFYMDQNQDLYIPKLGIFVGSEQTLNNLATSKKKTYILDSYKSPLKVETGIMDEVKLSLGLPITEETYLYSAPPPSGMLPLTGGQSAEKYKKKGTKRRGTKRRGTKRRGTKRRGTKRRGTKRRGTKRRN
jgi:hypothetical protein